MDEEEARRRLLLYTFVRFVGLVIFFAGIAIMYTPILRQGGWPQVGAIIAIFGVIFALLAPHFWKSKWDRKDRDSR